MNPTTSILERGDKKMLLTYVRETNLENVSPVTQVYGIVFNDKGEILVVRHGEDDKWQIPGGTPEEGETQLQTLNRELIEEADVTVKNATPLGYQKVEDITSGTPVLSSYQLRYVGILDELREQTIDPDPTKNFIWERKFVPASEVTSYVKWGELGNAMFNDAIKLYEELTKSN